MVYVLRSLRSGTAFGLFLSRDATHSKFSTWARQWASYDAAETARRQMAEGHLYEVVGVEE